MKTSTYTIVLAAILISSFSSFANTKPITTDNIKTNVPLAPRITISENLKTPENLSFIKAKNAFVPNAPFNFGSPLARVFELAVISPKLTLGNPDDAPIALGRIVARNAYVAIAPLILGNAQSDFPDGF